jgi:hypothetical protein
MGTSAGPKSRNGKLRSSRNAAKHWIESGRILPGEQEAAAVLQTEFMADLEPEGLLGIEIIDDLTLNRLVKRRIDVAFTREFARASIEKTIALTEKSEHSGTQYWLRRANWDGINWAKTEKAERLRPTYCVAALESLKRKIADRGPDPRDLEYLRELYGDQPTQSAATAMYKFLLVTAKQAVQDKTETLDPKKLKESILETLQYEIEFQRHLEELEAKAITVDLASSSQEPPRTELETLLRYRAANIREFKDLLECFERVRRLRRGAA